MEQMLTPKCSADTNIKPTIHYATKLHATNCNTVVTKVLHDCFNFVTALLQSVACNFVA